MRTYACMHTEGQMHKGIHKHIHVKAYINGCTHTHAYTHTHAHTYTHTHTFFLRFFVGACRQGRRKREVRRMHVRMTGRQAGKGGVKRQWIDACGSERRGGTPTI
jgi:hypothetical protein